jgi:hypothetical protein
MHVPLLVLHPPKRNIRTWRSFITAKKALILNKMEEFAIDSNINGCAIEAKRKLFDRVKTEWSYLPILRFLNFGFDRLQLAMIFHTLPPHVASEFKKILERLQDIMLSRTQHLANLPQLTSISVNDPDTVDVEADMWQSQNICGYMKCTYDPSSCQLVDFRFNDKMPQLLGLGREELQKRIEDQSLDLPCPAVDFLHLLIDDTKHSTQCRTER